MDLRRFNFTDKALVALPVPTDKRPVVYYDDGQAGPRHIIHI